MSEYVTFIHFRKTSEIGNNEGKNSEVFLAIDEQLGDELVIKRVDKYGFQPEEYFAEAQKLYANRHPNIMEIQYASQDDKSIYFAMPYYPDGSLNSIIEKRFLTIREIIRYSLDLLSGVYYIHSKSLLHLDIKPTNILISPTGKAVLTDFGLSKYMNIKGEARQDKTYLTHAEPEWFRNNPRTILSDIYQIGLTLYRLCNSNDIFTRQIEMLKITSQQELGNAVCKGIFPDRHCFLPHTPQKLKRIIAKAINANPTRRYNNTIELMNDLSLIDDNLDWVFTGNPDRPYYIDKGDHRTIISVACDQKKVECSRCNQKTKKVTKMHKLTVECNPETVWSTISDTINTLEREMT